MPITKRNILSKIYFPGMVSLICLPLSGMVYFAYYRSSHTLNALKIICYEKSEIINGTVKSKPVKNIDDFKKYTDITLNGEDGHDNAELKKLSDLTRYILNEKSYTDGIRINFTNTSKYKNFVAVMDIGVMNADKANFICIDNKVYVWKDKPNEFRRSLPQQLPIPL